jgi:hypothetical protein
MISLSLAADLKEAGLVWPASQHDFFAVPDRDMDDRVFVISNMPANLEILRGWPAITFHGTAEWALDYILTSEVVWLPREEQLREALLAASGMDSSDQLALTFSGGLYTCTITRDENTFAFSAAGASDAYGLALLKCLQDQLMG